MGEAVFPEVGAHKAEVGAHMVIAACTGARLVLPPSRLHTAVLLPQPTTLPHGHFARQYGECGEMVYSRMVVTKRHRCSSETRFAPTQLMVGPFDQPFSLPARGGFTRHRHCLHCDVQRPRQNGDLENGSLSTPPLYPRSHFTTSPCTWPMWSPGAARRGASVGRR